MTSLCVAVRAVAVAAGLVTASACSQIGQTATTAATTVITQADAQSCLDSYAAEFQRLSYASSLAE